MLENISFLYLLFPSEAMVYSSSMSSPSNIFGENSLLRRHAVEDANMVLIKQVLTVPAVMVDVDVRNKVLVLVNVVVRESEFKIMLAK